MHWTSNPVFSSSSLDIAFYFLEEIMAYDIEIKNIPNGSRGRLYRLWLDGIIEGGVDKVTDIFEFKYKHVTSRSHFGGIEDSPIFKKFKDLSKACPGGRIKDIEIKANKHISFKLWDITNVH